MNKKISFFDLFDLKEIQEIQDSFAKAAGVASIITDPKGRPLTAPSNFCRLYIDIIRKTENGLMNCMKSDAAIGCYNPDGPIVQPCLSGGLWDAGASIRVGNQHIANWLIGQVRNEAQSAEEMMLYARKIGADENEFRSALEEVTVMPLEQFREVAQALFLMANLMSRIAFQNIQLKDLTDNLEAKVCERTRQLQEARDELWSEMGLAKKIQTVLLPKKPERIGYDIAASMEPASEVGGDYYDMISVGGYDWIVIGDVSGHGVTSGLVMMMVQTAIHTVLIQNPQVPTSRLLSVINQTIYENIVKMDEQKHMTILVIACGKNGFFDFSGLHEDILLWRAQTRKVESIKTDGMWIGLDADISGMLPVSEFRLGTGDCLILYTDGIIEARGKDGRFFGTERLSAVIEASGGKSASEIHAAILNEIRDFEKPDDVTLFVMKRV